MVGIFKSFRISRQIQLVRLVALSVSAPDRDQIKGLMQAYAKDFQSVAATRLGPIVDKKPW